MIASNGPGRKVNMRINYYGDTKINLYGVDIGLLDCFFGRYSGPL